MNDKPTDILNALDAVGESLNFAGFNLHADRLTETRAAVAEIIRRNGELETALKRIRNMAGSSGALDLSIALPVRHIAEEALTGSDGRQQEKDRG